MGIKITNDIQVVMVKYLNPEIKGKKEFDKALARFVADGYAEAFRVIIDADSQINPDNRLIDIWNRARGKDPHGIIPLIVFLTVGLRTFESHLDASRHIIGDDLYSKFKEEYREKIRGFLRARRRDL